MCLRILYGSVYEKAPKNHARDPGARKSGQCHVQLPAILFAAASTFLGPLGPLGHRHQFDILRAVIRSCSWRQSHGYDSLVLLALRRAVESDSLDRIERSLKFG